MSDLQKLSTTQLIKITRNVKNGLMDVINMGEKAFEGKDPASASFAVKFLFLQAIEDEIRRRGINPSDPRFGDDLMAEIVSVQMDVLEGKL